MNHGLVKLSRWVLQRFRRRRLKISDKTVWLGKHIQVRGNLQVGNKVYLGDFSRYSGNVTIGNNCKIHPFSLLRSQGGKITIGNDCSINEYSILYGNGNITIGN